MKRFSFFQLTFSAWKQFISDIWRLRHFLYGAAVYLLAAQLLFHKLCPIVIVTGFPCPGCGITRALLLLLTGHPKAAWDMNPCIYAWLCFFALFFFFHYYRKSPTMQNRLILLTGTVTIAVYAVRMLLYFPDRTPYVYYDASLLHTIAAFFGYKP